MIVVDDGSTDKATQGRWTSCRSGVQLIRQQNSGLSVARNTGFERSDSELLLMVDADDRLHPDALDVLRPPLEANPQVGYCYGLMKLIGTWSGVLRFPDFDPYIVLHRSIAGAQLGLVRRRCWEEAGGFDPAIDGYEDWDFTLSALEKGWVGLQIDRVTHEYRKHERSGNEEHRRRYRHVYRQIRAKHADLFARRREFADADRPRASAPPRLPDLLGLAADPGPDREGALQQGALPRLGPGRSRAVTDGPLELPERPGPRPDTGPAMPHQQLSENAPAELQEELWRRMGSLGGRPDRTERGVAPRDTRPAPRSRARGRAAGGIHGRH